MVANKTSKQEGGSWTEIDLKNLIGVGLGTCWRRINAESKKR
jgi:hypothetical protein